MIQALAEKIVEYYLDGEGVDKDIKKSAEWAVKYFNTANEGNCTCPFCSPFRAMKKLAKYFIETPQEELIKLYDDDREKAAQVIFEFGLACEHSPVNISITLDVISIAADMIGEYCRKEILEHLANNYEKLYQELAPKECRKTKANAYSKISEKHSIIIMLRMTKIIWKAMSQSNMMTVVSNLSTTMLIITSARRSTFKLS